ncbi:MAG: amidohydrolase [Chloroflexi bacterium]|jgi:cytosine/adenosine deaminase-related metal-dependent hydrolase|nr:amidohydrolase [Chloroflexota bacterium]MCH2535839.1 amidohydrolase [Dehalococcoidia bacterium]MEE2928613.1 amidohydrolase [Chloroflexota bacterium]HIB13773.1 amidohydrolase [Dehalococcoidia bacterium]
MAETRLKIQGARYIMTLDPERRIIQDGSIIVEGQRILQVGKAAELESVTADRVIDGSEMVVTPGFCNGHMHISYAHATRGVFPDNLGASYLPNVFKLQGEMTGEEEYYTSLLAITELLRYGTTCFLDPGSTKHLETCMKAYEESGCRIIVGWHVADRPNPLNLPVSSTSEAISMMGQTIQSFDNRLDGRMRAWAMPFSPSFSTEELLLGAKELADRYGTGLTLHFNNSQQAVEASLSQHGKRPAEYLEDIGVLGPSTLLAHSLGIDQREVDAMARTGTKAVMCPTAAIKGGAGMTKTALLPELLRAGVTVGLGTDAGNNSNLVETMRSMYLAAVLYKDGREDVEMIPAETALEMATIKGAEALGLGDDIGSIEPGKKADLVLFDTKRPEWRTIFNPVNNLVYNADGRSVHTVIVDGKVVVENHEPLFVDQWELIQRVQKLGEGLLARTGISFPQRWPIV